MSMAAVVLAAGGSTRFGKPKQFALFQGETFIKRIVAAAIEAGCAPVVVVTGEDSAQVTLELTGRTVSIAMNPRWSSGLGSSIGVGVQRAMDLAADLDASLLLTCDQPFVTAAVLAQIIQLRLPKESFSSGNTMWRLLIFPPRRSTSTPLRITKNSINP